MTTFRSEPDMLLCSGDTWDADKSGPTNAEIVGAFSPSDHLILHCIINTAGRELLVAASSCKNAKIIAVNYGHLQAVSCGSCSKIDMQRLIQGAPEHFPADVQDAISRGEPSAVWRPGYLSERLDRLAKDRMDQLLAGIKHDNIPL